VVRLCGDESGLVAAVAAHVVAVVEVPDLFSHRYSIVLGAVR